MRTITKKIAANILAKTLLVDAPTLTLPFDARSKSRQKGVLSTGEEVAISLPRGTVMRAGEVLVAEDGRFIVVDAAPENILRVTAATPHDLLRAAYHLGNRHTPVEVGAEYLHLEYDPVLADMLRQLGVQVTQAAHPFEPEHGAYGGGHKHGHDETFAEDYQLAQAAYAAHDKPAHTHSHDGCCGHDHGHDHNHGHHHHS